MRSPEMKPVRSPEMEPVRSPQKRPMRSPQKRPMRSPQTEPTRSPETDPMRSPQTGGRTCVPRPLPVELNAEGQALRERLRTVEIKGLRPYNPLTRTHLVRRPHEVFQLTKTESFASHGLDRVLSGSYRTSGR